MDILFETEHLRQLCLNAQRAQRELGPLSAKKLQTRLSDMKAADRVTDLVAGHPHPLKGDRLGQFALNLHGGCRLVFEPAHDPCPTNPDGSTDWHNVTAVQIVFIGDYHD